MRTEDMLPVLTELDEVGFHSLEVWGRATCDVCLRFLGEDPWERLRTIKRFVRKTPLQMLLRGCLADKIDLVLAEIPLVRADLG